MAGAKGLVVMDNNILRTPVKIVLASSQKLLVVAVSPTEWSVMAAVSPFNVDFAFPLSLTRLLSDLSIYMSNT